MHRSFISALIIIPAFLLNAACGSGGAQITPSPPPHDMRNVFPAVEEVYEKIEVESVAIEFTVKSEDFFFGPKTVEAGGLATVKFRLTDAASGQPLTDTFPKAWIDYKRDSAPTGSEQQACEQRVASYLQGVLTDRPAIDLNSFFILSLNNEASVSVIDPLVNLAGITQLYTMIELPKPGEDWALTQDQTRLFITVPETGQVVVADTSNFEVRQMIDTGGMPVRAAFQPDEKYLWVGNDSDSNGGVIVIDLATFEIAAKISAGGGHHALAFSADSRYVFVTSEKAGTLTIIDTATLRKVKDVRTGSLPVAVDVSALTQSVYVADGKDGTITVLDGGDFDEQTVMDSAPGLYALRFTADGRWGFATNPSRNEMLVIDAANNRLAHTLTIGGSPDQISFSETAAYIHSLNLPRVGVIQLADLGKTDPPVVMTVSYGQIAPSQSPFQSVADGIIPSIREKAMLIASPGDGQIYYYPEGATSPAGSFQGYGRVPRAVQAVDRGFREEADGIYSARFRVPHGGEFAVAILLDEPRIVHCFNFTAKPGEGAEPITVVPELQFITEARQFQSGEEIRFQFSLSESGTKEPWADLADVVVVASQVGGNWGQRVLAESVGNGVYEFRLTIPQAGNYTILFTIPSANIEISQLPPLGIEVVP